MIDSVIAGTGNSRYLRTSLPASTTWEDALTMLRAGTFPIDLAGINLDGFVTLGTALNSDTLLKSAIITALDLDADATPSDAWEAVLALIDTKAEADAVVTGLSYDGATKTLSATINGASVTVATFNFTTPQEAAAAAPVQSVAGRTGNVTLTKSDVGLGNVDNTSDADKPISTATQEALNAKQNTLTFDTTPTSGSTNPVTSGGVYTEVSQLKSAISFYDFGKCTSRIDWDTVNKTVTLGVGYFIYGNAYKTISAQTTISYTSFGNTTVLLYDGTNFVFRPFNNLNAGAAVALFDVDKMYMPFDYGKVYVNGEKITTANLFNDFTSFVDAIEAKVTVVDGKINSLSGKVDILFPEVTAYEQDSTRNNATSDNIWVINELIVPANAVITTIDAYVREDTQKTFHISLWNTETKEKYADLERTVMPVQSVAHIVVNYKTTAPTKIGFYSAAAATTVANASGKSLLYVAPSVDSLENASLLNKWGINAVIKIILPNDPPILQQEIHVGDGLAFTEIQPAIESVTGDYATIIVHPKSTPYSRFSLMRSLDASYPWTGLTTVKHISIIGVDKAKCVIQDNSGNYDTPPAEIATNGVIKNLTFIATHSESTGEETTGSYAVHVDNRPADTNGMKLVFENCDFVSYQTAAVGLGLYKNQDILFDSCNFKSVTDSEWKPNEDYNSAYMCALGAYFMHTTMGYAGGNMFIRFRNCFLYHEGGDYTMRIGDADETQTAYLEAIGNTLWNPTTNKTDYHTTNNPIMQMPYNHGNNATELNQMGETPVA